MSLEFGSFIQELRMYSRIRLHYFIGFLYQEENKWDIYLFYVDSSSLLILIL